MALDVDESFPYGQIDSHGFPIKRSLCFVHKTYISFLNFIISWFLPAWKAVKS